MQALYLSTAIVSPIPFEKDALRFMVVRSISPLTFLDIGTTFRRLVIERAFLFLSRHFSDLWNFTRWGEFMVDPRLVRCPKCPIRYAALSNATVQRHESRSRTTWIPSYFTLASAIPLNRARSSPHHSVVRIMAWVVGTGREDIMRSRGRGTPSSSVSIG